MSEQFKSALAELMAEPPVKKEVTIGAKVVPICLRPPSVEAAEAVYGPLRDESGKIPAALRPRMLRALVAVTVVDESGRPLFSEAEVSAWPNTLFSGVNDLVLEINGVPPVPEEEEAPNA